MMTHAFIVKGISKERALPWYASVNDDFEPFSNENGPLEKSRFRAKLRLFSSKEAAETFVREYQNKPFRKVFSITIEDAPQELLTASSNIYLERSRIINRLIPLVDRVIASFDFSEVRELMAVNHSSYTSSETPPSLEELQTAARQLLIQAACEDNDAYQEVYQRGGFRAWRSLDELYLSFGSQSARAAIPHQTLDGNGNVKANLEFSV
jgi:hypothetical protein